MIESFSNEQLSIDHLPKIDDVQFQKVHKEYLNVQLMASGIFWLFVTAGVFIWLTLNTVNYPSWIDWGGVGFLVFLAGLNVFFEFRLHQRRGYALREKDIMYRDGFLWRSITVIPFNRIQHAEVQQGPIDRLFNLSKINIFTAGGSSSDLSIPGLRPEESESLKYFVINKTAIDEEE